MRKPFNGQFFFAPAVTLAIGSVTEPLESRRLLSTSLAVGSTLYTVNGGSLYASHLDGSNQQLLKQWSTPAPTNLFAFHDQLIFSAGAFTQSPVGVESGAELWGSDGTPDGTALIDDINNGHRASNPRDFHVVNDHLVFLVDDADYVVSLWASDGTSQTTDHLLSTYTDSATIEQPVTDVVYTATSVSATLHNGHTGFEDRWTSDGTLAGSHYVYSLAPGGVLSGAYAAARLVPGDPGFLNLFTDSTGVPIKMLASSVQSIHLSAYNDEPSSLFIDPSLNIPATLTGGTSADTLIGGAANDVIIGNGGGDSIDGQGGADTITASTHHDTIVAGAGDTIIDTDGGGTVVVPTPARATVSLRGGTLRINGTEAADALQLASDGNTLTVSLNGVASGYLLGQINSVIIHGAGGDDEIALNNVALKTRLYGDAGNDTVYASSGKDRIYGGDGDDWIDGGDNHDTLYGEAGDDRVFGGGGNDHIDGGAGVNVLRGGGGHDILTGHRTDDLHANIGDVIRLI